MSVEQIVITKLEAVSAITDIVGDEITIAKARQDSGEKYIVVKYIDGVEVHAMGQSSGTGEARLQIDAYTEKYADLVALRKLIKDNLSRWPKNESVSPVGGVTATDAIINVDLTTYEDKLEKHRAMIDLTIQYKEV